jgi:protein-disulfide isomerase
MPFSTRRRSLMVYVSLCVLLMLMGLITANHAFASNGIPVYGSPDAPTTFSLWGSLTCPYTRQLFFILTRIVDQSNSGVNVEWHHLPVHDSDPGLHVLASAREERFWALARRIFRAEAEGTAISWERFVEWAGAEGIPDGVLQSAWSNQAKWDAVKEDYLASKLLGVEGTPGLFFAGYFLTPAGLPKDLVQFEQVLVDLVAKARGK